MQGCKTPRCNWFGGAYVGCALTIPIESAAAWSLIAFSSSITSTSASVALKATPNARRRMCFSRRAIPIMIFPRMSCKPPNRK